MDPNILKAETLEKLSLPELRKLWDDNRHVQVSAGKVVSLHVSFLPVSNPCFIDRSDPNSEETRKSRLISALCVIGAILRGDTEDVPNLAAFLGEKDED